MLSFHRGCFHQAMWCFDKVQCRELEVVDANGNKAISLRSNDTSSTSVYYDKQGNVAMILGSIDENRQGSQYL